MHHTRKLIDGMKTIGCKVAFENFVKAMSSLLHLRRLPADYVKIDVSFIHLSRHV